jgi:drug/metabolite transporter (DMT)-like permease
MAIVGSSVAAGKLVVETLPVGLAMGLRFALAAALSLPLLYRREGGLPRLSARSWALLVVQALAGVFAFNWLLLWGLERTSAVSAGVVAGATPLVMGLASALVLGERPGWAGWGGIALAAAGVMAHNASGAGEGPAGASWAGLGLVLAAVCCETVFLLLRKALREPLSALAGATLMSCLGLVLFAPFAVADALTSGLSSLTPGAWVLVGWYGAGISVAAYLFWFRGVVATPAHAAGVFTGILPLSAVGLSALVLGESLDAAQAAGCAAVVAGIVLVSLGPGNRRRRTG